MSYIRGTNGFYDYYETLDEDQIKMLEEAEKLHEELMQKEDLTLSEFSNIYKINDAEINFMIQVIYPKNIQDPKQYLYQIISNENGIDVDRFDYLSRDIKMIGLNYGIEYERIMNHSKIENNEIIYH